MQNILKLWLFAIVIITGPVLLNSCTKANYDDGFTKSSPPPIGPYDVSDDVAKDALVAKWSFESGLNDSIQNLAATKDTARDYVTGRWGFGRGIQCKDGGYVVYGSAGTLPSLKTFSVTFWMNAPQTNGVARGIFSLNRTDDFWGNVDVYMENFSDPNIAYLKVHLNNDNAGAWKGQFPETKIASAIGKWVHIAITYDSATSIFNIYANSQPQTIISAGNPSPGKVGPYLYSDDPAGTPVPKYYGPIKFLNATSLAMGTFQFQTNPPLNNGGSQSWAGSFLGALDEFRIYNRALTPQEVNALFRLEKLGK